MLVETMAWERKSKATSFWLTFLFLALFIGVFARFVVVPQMAANRRSAVAIGVVIATDGPSRVVEYPVSGAEYRITGACDCEFGEEVPVYYPPTSPAEGSLVFGFGDRWGATIIGLILTGFASAVFSWHIVYHIAPKIFHQR